MPGVKRQAIEGPTTKLSEVESSTRGQCEMTVCRKSLLRLKGNTAAMSPQTESSGLGTFQCKQLILA